MKKKKHQRAKHLPVPMYQRLQLMAQPLGAITNLERNGFITEDQLGTLYALAMICRKAAKACGIEYSAEPVFKIGRLIRLCEPVDEEDILACRKSLEECDAVLKRISANEFDTALKEITVMDAAYMAMRGYGVAEAMACA